MQDKGNPATAPLSVGVYAVDDSCFVEGVVLKAWDRPPAPLLEDLLMGQGLVEDWNPLHKVFVVDLAPDPVRTLDDAIRHVGVSRHFVARLQLLPQRNIDHDPTFGHHMVREVGVFV